MFNGAPQLSYDDLITGEKFVSMCDEVWFHYSHYHWQPKAESRVFYCDNHYLEELFARLPQDREVVVVSHNADRYMGEHLLPQVPPNVKAWYAQNVGCISDILHPIPIGLENERWFPDIRKKHKLLEWRARNVKPSKLLYMNHAIWTNPAIRQIPYRLFGDKPWCTSLQRQNGQQFDDYLAEMSDHFFVISPEGNGIDCHRTWEAIYSGRVPIVTENANTRLYNDLPVLVVKSWEEVTEVFLRESMDRMLSGQYNFEKLKFEWWKQCILNRV